MLLDQAAIQSMKLKLKEFSVNDNFRNKLKRRLRSKRDKKS